MLAVVEKLEWPIQTCTSFIGILFLMSRLAQECPYGIITTNRKSPVYQGLSVIWQGLPDTENPYLDNPDTEAPDTDNPAQLNTKKSNTQKSNTDLSSTHSFFLPAADGMTDGLEKKAEIREQIESAARLLPVNPRRVPLSGGILPKGGQPYGFLMG